MKRLKSIATIFLISLFLICSSSCVVLVKHDNGKHKGWTKKNNPHRHYALNPLDVNGKKYKK